MGINLLLTWFALWKCFSEQVGLCSEPGGVLHARRSGALFPYQLDNQILYTCDPCFLGGGTITCLSSGQWSGVVACEESE